MATCDDLRLGGTLTGAGITGGVSINNAGIGIEDWSGVLGSGGMSGRVQVVNNRPGGFLSGDLLGRERYPTLNMILTDRDATGGLTAATFPEQKQANTDTFLALITDPAGNYLEVDMPDGTSRFLYVYNLDAAAMRQPRKQRTISVPLVSPFPYWKGGGNQSTDTIAGADTMVVGGNREVYDAVLVFSGDGTFTHSTEGWAITIAGSSGAVTVDLGNRTVTDAGGAADNLMSRTNAFWGWFNPGNNSVTSTVSVGVTWRSSFA